MKIVLHRSGGPVWSVGPTVPLGLLLVCRLPAEAENGKNPCDCETRHWQYGYTREVSSEQLKLKFGFDKCQTPGQIHDITVC